MDRLFRLGSCSTSIGGDGDPSTLAAVRSSATLGRVGELTPATGDKDVAALEGGAMLLFTCTSHCTESSHV